MEWRARGGTCSWSCYLLLYSNLGNLLVNLWSSIVVSHLWLGWLNEYRRTNRDLVYSISHGLILILWIGSLILALIVTWIIEVTTLITVATKLLLLLIELLRTLSWKWNSLSWLKRSASRVHFSISCIWSLILIRYKLWDIAYVIWHKRSARGVIWHKRSAQGVIWHKRRSAQGVIWHKRIALGEVRRLEWLRALRETIHY